MSYRPRNFPTMLALLATLTLLATLCPIGAQAATVESKLAPVSGKVTYDDGSLIPGARIQIVLIPHVQVPEGAPQPRPSIADIDVEDGTFDFMSTFEEADGATVGVHRIMITVLGPDGKLNGAVPGVFSDPRTTPLRIDIEDKKNWIHFQLPKSARK